MHIQIKILNTWFFALISEIKLELSYIFTKRLSFIQNY